MKKSRREATKARRREVLEEVAAFQQKHGLRSSPTAVEDVREIRSERARQLINGKPEGDCGFFARMGSNDEGY